MSSVRRLCHTCLVLVAFRWAETQCIDCDRLNGESFEHLSA